MAERIAPVDPALDELKRKARRRLVGAVVLALAAAVILPMLLEKEPRPLGEDVAVRIPPVDEGKFVNRLSKPAGDSKVADTKARTADGEKPAAALSSATSPSAAAATTTADGASNAAPPETLVNPMPAPASESVTEAEKRVLSPTTTTASTDTRIDTPSEPKTEPKVEVKPEPKAAATTAAPAVVASKAGGSGSGASASDAFVVQLAAFSDDKGANALASKLKRNGYPAYTEPITTSRGTLFRVRVGSYPSRESAGEARSKLKGDGYSGIIAPAH